MITITNMVSKCKPTNYIAMYVVYKATMHAYSCLCSYPQPNRVSDIVKKKRHFSSKSNLQDREQNL